MSEEGMKAARSLALANPQAATALAADLRNAVVAAKSSASELIEESPGYIEQEDIGRNIMLSVDLVLALAAALSPTLQARAEMPTLPEAWPRDRK